MKTIFIVGTDTEVGKTHCTELLLNALKQENKKVIGAKPIASGAHHHHQRLLNNDALKLMHASTIQRSYEQHNPFVFQEPISPHIAAEKEKKKLSVKNTVEALQPIFSSGADYVFIEGAGGLLTPLNERELFSDLIAALDCPAILVVDLKLGGINHALLTLHAMQERKIKCLGWIANNTKPETDYTERMRSDLKTRLWVPHLLTIDHGQLVINEKIVL